ncbi:MAG: signal peptidase II [Phycisphaerales bacterium]
MSDEGVQPPVAGAAPEPKRSEPPRRAGSSAGAWALLLACTAVALALDLWTKSLAFAQVAGAPVHVRRADVLSGVPLDALVRDHHPVKVIPSVLEFTLVLNPGAVFGIGAGQRWFFILFTMVALVFAMVVFARWTTSRDRAAHIALALLIAGGLGNLYDRIVYACVRDFIHPLPGVKLPFGIAWPSGSGDVWPYVSNVADLFLLVGIGALLVCSWRGSSASKHRARSEPGAAPPAPHD